MDEFSLQVRLHWGLSEKNLKGKGQSSFIVIIQWIVQQNCEVGVDVEYSQNL